MFSKTGPVSSLKPSNEVWEDGSLYSAYPNRKLKISTISGNDDFFFFLVTNFFFGKVGLLHDFVLFYLIKKDCLIQLISCFQ